MPKSTPPLSTVAQARISSANPLLAMAPATNVLKRNQVCVHFASTGLVVDIRFQGVPSGELISERKAGTSVLTVHIQCRRRKLVSLPSRSFYSPN